MTQSELNRRVMLATGDDYATVVRYGWLLSHPDEEITDPYSEELGPWVLDFDEDPHDSETTNAKLPLDIIFA